jgi:hypothetical protein
MKVRQQILLYGNSVILGFMSAFLQRFLRFEVTKPAAPLQELRELNGEHAPREMIRNKIFKFFIVNSGSKLKEKTYEHFEQKRN